jgi:hypothetical protein
MSEAKVNHNKYQFFVDQALDVVGGSSSTTDPNETSIWVDTSGWTDKKISYESDGANPDFDIIMHISPYGAYELNNMTATTDHYEVINIVTAHGAQILVSVDAEDIDELQHPVASTRFYVDNDSATAISAFNLILEGWS